MESLKELELSDEEIKNAVSDVKRIWKGSKREIVYSDKLSKPEVLIISDDILLRQLAHERRVIESRIIDRVDKLLRVHREYLKEMERGIEVEDIG